MKKKIIYGICMLGFVAMMTTSCKKKEETTSFLFDEIPMEMDDMNDSRHYFDPSINNFYWETTDYIKVYNADNNQSAQFRVTQVSGTSMTMTGPNIGSVQNMYAFYPYEMAASPFDVEDMRQTFTLGNVDIESNTFDNVFQAKLLNNKYTVCDAMFPKASKKGTNGRFSFKNYFGMAKVFVEGRTNPNGGPNAKIVSLKIIDNAFKLWGTVSLRPFVLTNNEQKLKDILDDYIHNNVQYQNHTNWSWVIGDLGYCVGNDGNKEIELRFDRDGEPEITNQAVICYFGLRPGSLGKGFKLLVELDNGQIIECDEYYNFVQSNIFHRNWVVQNGKIKDYTFNISEKINWSLYE